MSLDDILARLNELERLSRPGERPVDRRVQSAPEPERIESLPQQKTIITPADDRAGEQLVTPNGAVETDEFSGASDPTTTAADTRYGKSPAQPESARSTSGAYGIVFGHRIHKSRPDPVDISVAAIEDALIVEPEMKQTKQLDFKMIAMSAVYLAIVIFAIAVAMFIYSST